MNYKKETLKRFDLLVALTKLYDPQIFIKPIRINKDKDKKSNWIFEVNHIRDLKKYDVDNYSLIRLYNRIMSEMCEYYLCLKLPAKKNYNTKDRMGDLFYRGIKYDVKVCHKDWSGNMIRKYKNQKYMFVQYNCRLDFTDKEKFKSMINKTIKGL